MVRFEVEISTSVGGFFVNFADHYHLFHDDQNIQNIYFTSSIAFPVNVAEATLAKQADL
jgi:hypothetical protein